MWRQDRGSPNRKRPAEPPAEKPRAKSPRVLPPLSYVESDGGSDGGSDSDGGNGSWGGSLEGGQSEEAFGSDDEDCSGTRGQPLQLDSE